MAEEGEDGLAAAPNEKRRMSADLRALIHDSGLAIVSLDPEGRVTSWNAGAEALLGYARDEMLGAEYMRLLPGDRRGELTKAMEKVRRGRTMPHAETSRVAKDGTAVDVIFSIFPARADDGSVAGFVTVMQDVTDRKRVEQALKESAAQIHAIVNTIVDGLVTIDASGIINAFNPGAEKIFQYRAHEVIGQNVKMLMPEPYHSEHDGYLANYRETRVAKVIGRGREVTGRRKDGSTFPMDLAISEMKLATGSSFVGLVRDATERKQAEEALREQMTRTATANEELAAANEELEATNQLLRDTQGQLVEAEKMASLGSLVAGVAHEINTPLGVGLSAASHFREQVQALGVDLAEGRLKKSSLEAFCASSNQAADMILSNLKRAADLVKSFKQVSVDQVSNERRRFDLKEYLDELMASLSPMIRETAVHVSLKCPDDIEMDSYPGPLAQVVTNMVSNALKHGYEAGQQGRIKIIVAQHGEEIEIICHDDGKGIPEADQSRVFDPFFTTQRSNGGTGLGLSVTYNLVTQTLKGRISLNSSPETGTEFRVRIPRVVDRVVDGGAVQ